MRGLISAAKVPPYKVGGELEQRFIDEFETFIKEEKETDVETFSIDECIEEMFEGVIKEPSTPSALTSTAPSPRSMVSSIELEDLD